MNEAATRSGRGSAREIYLVRHGETEWNRIRRFQGRLDSPLTTLGVAQAEACGRLLAERCVEADAFVVSPLGRARQTSEIIRSFGHYPDTRSDDRLAELSMGVWDGLTRVDIDAGWPELLGGSTRYDWYFRSPDGERYEAAVARVRDWLDEVEGTVVAISHGLLGRIMRGVYLGLAKEEALGLPVPQDVIWHLADGGITAIAA